MTSPLAPALNALQAGNPSRAATLLRQRLVDKPDEPDALNLLGMAQLDLEFDDLPSALARSLAVAPGEPAFLRNLGLAGLRRDRL